MAVHIEATVKGITLQPPTGPDKQLYAVVIGDTYGDEARWAKLTRAEAKALAEVLTFFVNG